MLEPRLLTPRTLIYCASMTLACGPSSAGDSQGDANATTSSDDAGQTTTTGELPPETDESGTGAGDDGLDSQRPFDPPSARSALHRIKSFLVGAAPTEDEYRQYLTNPASLPALIDGWTMLPAFEIRAKEMLRLLFQQGAGSDEIGLLLRERNTDIFQQRQGRGGVDLEGPMRESWERSAWEIIAEDRPFTEVATTRRYYLNVPLMMALAYMDATPRDDTNAYVPGHSWLEQRFAELEVSYVRDEVIPFAESTDPNSEHFGRFSIGEPDGSAAGSSACEGLTRTFDGRAAIEEIFKTMMGVPFRTTCWSWNGAKANVFDESDLAFRKIHIRPPEPGEDPTIFWDLATLRDTEELVLHTEYVGYFGTLGFLAQWTTNDANEHRVTANQTLIVGLGRSFDPGSIDVDIDDLGEDDLHALPGTPCHGCHVTLDPLRDFFRQSHTYYGSARVAGMGANEDVPAQAIFTIDGSPPVRGHGVGDLGSAIAGSSRFASAWAEKLCNLVNAGHCAPDDPELARIAAAFADSGHRFRVLLRELLASPIVTHQTRTLSWDLHDEPVGSALQDDLCRRLEARSGINDACALRDELDARRGDRERIRAYAQVVASLGYRRGAVAPDHPIAPGLFSTAGSERLCETLAELFIRARRSFDADAPALRRETIDGYLSELMGLASDDPARPELEAILDAHWSDTLAAGHDADVAMQSTFVLACTSPRMSALGI